MAPDLPQLIADADGAVAQIIRASSLTAERWRNGAGTARRIATGGDGRHPEWTLSLADIERRCEFSSFPGFDRTAVVVGDDPVEMTINATTCVLDLLDRVSFAGEDDVLADPTRGSTCLLNLMTRRGVTRGQVSLRHLRGSHTFEPDGVQACTVLAGSLLVGDAELRRCDTVLPGDEQVQAVGAATVAIVTIHQVSAADRVHSSTDKESCA